MNRCFSPIDPKDGILKDILKFIAVRILLSRQKSNPIQLKHKRESTHVSEKSKFGYASGMNLYFNVYQ